ncbi:hypothetical protein BMI90_12870 [Thioclava sp. L04-15]|nr:hypothetical protein BMI90_12870 [Thioclava sp. L04-15]
MLYPFFQLGVRSTSASLTLSRTWDAALQGGWRAGRMCFDRSEAEVAGGAPKISDRCEMFYPFSIMTLAQGD